MEADKDAAQVKTPMIYICGECHRWEAVPECVSLSPWSMRCVKRS